MLPPIPELRTRTIFGQAERRGDLWAFGGPTAPPPMISTPPRPSGVRCRRRRQERVVLSGGEVALPSNVTHGLRVSVGERHVPVDRPGPQRGKPIQQRRQRLVPPDRFAARRAVTGSSAATIAIGSPT